MGQGAPSVGAAGACGPSYKPTSPSSCILMHDGLGIAIRPRVRSVAADMPPGRDNYPAANRRNNDRADNGTTDATCIVDADRAVHDGVGFGNGKCHQQGDDCIFHLRTPSVLVLSRDIIVSFVRSNYGKKVCDCLGFSRSLEPAGRARASNLFDR